MHDFFTELDSDLQDVKKTPNSPEKQEELLKKEEIVAPLPEVILPSVSPPRREPRDLRERISLHEGLASNFSTTGTPAFLFPQTKSQSLPPLQKGYTRIISIGGQNETGKYMSMYQYEDEIILIGGGIQFPKQSMLGAKYSLPDLSLLISMKQKIKGIIVTHGHLENIAWLKHILSALGYPKIYGTLFTIRLIEQQLENVGMLSKVDFHIINPDQDGLVQVSPNIQIELFRQNFSIPDAVGVYIETPHARIVYTGDFNMSIHPSDKENGNREKLKKIGTRGIDLLMSASHCSLYENREKTDAEIGEKLHSLIQQTRGRIIIPVCATLMWRIIQILESAKSTGRTVFLNGRDITESIALGRSSGHIPSHLDSPKQISNKIDSLSGDRQLILTTGSPGDLNSWLYRMTHWEHPVIKIRPDDTVILSSHWANNLTEEEGDLMNILLSQWATVFVSEGVDVSTERHGTKKEQWELFQLIRPRNFMPVQWDLFRRVEHKKTIMGQWMDENHIYLCENGTILDIDENRGIHQEEALLKMEEIVVDGQGMGISTTHVIEARSQMMKSGVITIIFKADEQTKTLLGHLKIETRGLVYVDEVREIHKLIIKKARASYEDTIKDIPDIEEKDLLKIVRRDLESFLVSKMERNPMIITMVVYM